MKTEALRRVTENSEGGVGAQAVNLANSQARFFNILITLFLIFLVSFFLFYLLILN